MKYYAVLTLLIEMLSSVRIEALKILLLQTNVMKPRLKVCNCKKGTVTIISIKERGIVTPSQSLSLYSVIAPDWYFSPFAFMLLRDRLGNKNKLTSLIRKKEKFFGHRFPIGSNI